MNYLQVRTIQNIFVHVLSQINNVHSTVVRSTRIIIISLNRLHLTRNGKETLFILLLEELELYVYVPDNIPESQRSLFEF